MYYGINVNIITFSNYYNYKGYKVYQGIYPEYFANYIYKYNIDFIMPTLNLLEYQSKTFDIQGNIKIFYKIFTRTDKNFITHFNILIDLLRNY